MPDFACRYRRPDIAITLIMEHDKAEWPEACNAAHRHLGLERDLKMEARFHEVMAGRTKS